uniref:Crystallin zeta like 2 n=1 Tax=Jaculus jaculus TaxID=51337 RepID=A0A8C5L983_JACJA
RRCLPPAWLCTCSPDSSPPAALCAGLQPPLTALSRARIPPHVRVGVHFCGVNFADILVCHGQYQEKLPLPFTPGLEFSGTVLEMSTDVSTVKEVHVLKSRESIYGVSSFTTVAEECLTLWKIPENVSLQEAAVLPISYGTAILALEHQAHTQPGETVLVTAAAGATGLAVIDVATNIFQAKVFGGLKEAVKKLVGSSGVNVATDMEEGDIFLAAVRSLAWEGRIVVLGCAGGNISSVPTKLLFLKTISAMGLCWGRYRLQNFPFFFFFPKSLSSALQYASSKGASSTPLEQCLSWRR